MLINYNYYVYVVILLVEFLRQSRPRGDTVRPAMSLEKDTWSSYKMYYRDKEKRDTVINEILKKHLDENFI